MWAWSLRAAFGQKSNLYLFLRIGWVVFFKLLILKVYFFVCALGCMFLPWRSRSVQLDLRGLCAQAGSVRWYGRIQRTIGKKLRETFRVPIPSLDMHGLLPIGVHECGMHEIEQAFCWNPHRVQLFQGLQDFIAQRWLPLGIHASFWINGSFTRRKETPEDIDLVADVSHVPAADMLPVIMLHYDNPRNKANYHIDFWFKHPMLPNDLTSFFSIHRVEGWSRTWS